MSLFIIVLIVVIFVLLWKLKDYKIEFNSFFKKCLPAIDDRFGCYFITGKQGTYKSFYAIKLLLAQDKTLCNKIKTNMKSIKIPDYKIEYFDRVEEIYKDSDEYCIYVLDEVARKYDKNSKTDKHFYAWLNQSRKTHRIVIMITQEWKELPMWIRRPAKYMITTIKNPLLNKFKIYQTIIGDAENMVLNTEEMEWECPPIKRVLWKPNLYITNYYDTFEVVNDL